MPQQAVGMVGTSLHPHRGGFFVQFSHGGIRRYDAAAAASHLPPEISIPTSIPYLWICSIFSIFLLRAFSRSSKRTSFSVYFLIFFIVSANCSLEVPCILSLINDSGLLIRRNVQIGLF